MTWFCCKCHLSFGLAEKRVAIDTMRVMHEHCYQQHLRDLQTRSTRISKIASQTAKFKE